MKKSAIFLVALLLTGWAAWAQYRVEGNVLSPDGSRLAGASIRLDGRVLASGIQGEFVFEDVMAGKYSLTVTHLGFEQFFRTLDVGGNVQVEVVLNETSIMTSEVTVAAIKANRNDPVAFSEITQAEIVNGNFGQDIPYLLNMTPGLVVSSDAGAGVGYTGMRLRGTDVSRINVTVNGIPLNDSESQGVYWVNMPDFASSVNEVQIQRGVGTSTNGAASFGGSINFSTLEQPEAGSVVVDNSYGSFNTLRNSVSVQTVLSDRRFAFDLRLSRLVSDGFVDRGASNLKSFYVSGGYFGDRTSVKIVASSGLEKTYQAWNGVPKVKLDNDVAGMHKLIMMDGWSEPEAENLLNANARTFNRYLYNNQTDNYQQDHYQVHVSHRANTYLLLNLAAHYTRGKGYYESYKYDQKFTKYNFPFEAVTVNGVEVTRTDLIAQKWLDNHFYGITGSGLYKRGILSLVTGGAINQYLGDHYGKVVWAAFNAGLPENHQWYQSEGTKLDLNYYTKATIRLNNQLSLYGDLQARHVWYDMVGFHDDGRDLTQSNHYNFFNPKVGLSYSLMPGSRFYASAGIANREPTRNDFRDADIGKTPQPERLVDYEAGLEWTKKNWSVQINGFYMDYVDQLVLTGNINNVGSPIMENVPESYRLGCEVSGKMRINQWIHWGGNVVWSVNKIKGFTEYVDVWDDYSQQATYLGTTDIAFSPNWTMASQFTMMPVTRLTATLNSRYVGKQFIDNTSNAGRRLDAYLVNDLVVRYVIPNKGNFVVEIGGQINNLLNEIYIANAWVYSYIYGGTRDVLDGYFPQAGRHFMGQVVVKF